MDQSIVSTVDKNPDRKPRVTIFFVICSLLMLATVVLGFFIERELLARVMYYIQQQDIPIGKFHPSVLGLTFLFAFGLPLGMVALFGYTIVVSEEKAGKIRSMVLVAFLLFSIVVLVPVIFGRSTSNLYFGTGGFMIVVAIISFFWLLSRFRSRLNSVQKSALDYKALGYLCFGIVTWHICGFSNAPGFALFPEKMLELGVRPFAIGQLKAIMAYFVLGWIFTAIGYYKSTTIHRK